ncbi:hypothetical protein ACU6S5_19495, partial [Acinetobacter baumannii]
LGRRSRPDITMVCCGWPGHVLIRDRSAGDCTTVPYKQIIIAAGEGAKASLSAFDYLIRTSAK